MLVVILNQYLIKKRKQEEYKTAHSSPPDYEIKNIVSSSDGVSCAEKDEEEKCSYKLSDVNKVFPQVKTLCIGPNVMDIVIRNAMFPNVEKVISDNPMFASGNMLVKQHILFKNAILIRKR